MTYRSFCTIASEKIYNDKNCPAEQKDRGTAVFEAQNLVKHFAGDAFCTYRIDEEISPDCEKKLFSALEKKLSGIPLQYILGEWEFYGERIFCGKGCLIPRPETEFLAEFAIKNLPSGGKFFDICTGSGCIPVAILKNRPDSFAYCLDISEDALLYARKNCGYHNLDSRMNIINCDAAEFETDEKFDIILSNPPYIKSCDMKNLSAEVLNEPHIALDGGEDGLLFYRLIVERYTKNLKKGGVFAFEAGEDTSHSVGDILTKSGFFAEYIKDYSGIDRVIIGRKKDE
ncbi:MAG: peptide chain release factor N(5)-glutamine methyltransferase [Ruminococcaceae bacterium]|nr:peptide chain release factor N(5)-glutamine methyltransferase [Oscillospiraceae bacterium]